MRKFYLSLCALALGTSIAGASDFKSTFDGDFDGWAVQNNGQAKIENGHLVVTMAGPDTNQKYRADIKLNDVSGLTLTKDEVVAIKFIGSRPDGSLKLDVTVNEGGGDGISNKAITSSVTTENKNNIYYYVVPADITSVKNFTIKIADAIKEPFSYTIDWIRIFPSMEALEANKNWNDDTNDTDEPAQVLSPVVNETTNNPFDTLETAIAAATEGDVIAVNKDQVFTDRITKSITIKGNGNVKISRGPSNNKLLFLSNTNTSNITLEDIAIDGISKELGVCVLEASNNGTITLKNVKFVNCATTNGQGLICVKGGGKLNAENVTAENCTVPAGRGEIFAGTNGVKLSGNSNMSVYIEKSNNINAAGLTTPITIYFDSNRASGTDLVKGNTDASLFTLADGKYTLVADGNNLKVYDKSTTGIESIFSGEAAANVNVYNMQGMLIRANVSAESALEGLAPGLYIINGKKVAVGR